MLPIARIAMMIKERREKMLKLCFTDATLNYRLDPLHRKAGFLIDRRSSISSVSSAIALGRATAEEVYDG